MSNSKVIDLYTKEGDLVAYCPLSARLPAFLERFGPEQGFAVRTEIADTLSLKPGLLRLYAAALRTGRKPEELGLPALALASQTLVCRATLENESGRVLATATAAKPIQAYKDLEVLETAARQRLLAALGFGGDMLDADETRDQRDQGLTAPLTLVGASTPVRGAPVVPVAPPSPVLPLAAASSEGEAAPTALDPASVASAPAAEDSVPVAPATLAPPMPTPAPRAPGAAPVGSAPANDEAALTLLRRQLAHLAKTRGVEPPVVTTRADAQAVLRQLMQPAAH